MPLVLDGTNGVSGVDGTASNPAIEGTDSNTGIFYPAADTVAIGTGGTEALRVNSSQNVGIGTTSPTTKLHVVGVVTATQGVTGTPTFSASQTNPQTISTVTFTKLQFNVEDWDTAACYDNVTNYRFTPNVAGYYQVSARTQFTQDSAARVETFISIYKNGSEHRRLTSAFGAPGVAISAPSGSALIYLNGTTDYIEAYVYYSGGSATTTLSSTTYLNFFQAVLARAA